MPDQHYHYNTTQRINAFQKLTCNYPIFKAGDTISANGYGHTYTVTHTVISGIDLTIVAKDTQDKSYNFRADQIRKV